MNTLKEQVYEESELDEGGVGGGGPPIKDINKVYSFHYHLRYPQHIAIEKA